MNNSNATSHTWLEPAEVTVPVELQAAVGGHPLVAATLVRRGLTAPDAARAFLDPTGYTPTPARALPGLSAAAMRLGIAIRRHEPICVWGDFDVDGQTATALLVATLRDLGATVSYHIPVRQAESHGVSLPALKTILDAGTRLLLTCDTGISAHEALAHAAACAIDVIVTDHHALPAELPPAYALVNPQLLPAGHPLRALPGAGVAYKLAEELYARAGRPVEATQYLDLVALAIVADLALLHGDTRHLLQRGLAALRSTERAGLRAMCELNRLDPAALTEEHIGFILAPRLNALGRLDDANPAVDFLITHDLAQARIMAANLEELNARRKSMCDAVYAGALSQLRQDPSLLEHAALVLAGPAWPAGVIGIVAGRLAERYNRPSVLIASPPGQSARGSARSVAGCDITAALATQASLLNGFGGHPMAAGLSIDPTRIAEFRRGLSRTVSAMLDAAPSRSGLQITGYLPLAALNLDLVRDLERLAPFGPGNPALALVSSGLSVKGARPVGRSEEHILLELEDGDGAVHRAIWWGGAGEMLPDGRFDLAYSARASDYRGVPEVQVEWLAARPLEGGPTEVATSAPARFTVVDYRREPDPHATLETLRTQEEVLVWCEGPEHAALRGRTRLELAPARALAIWTAPAGRAELLAALERVSPATVYLFALDPGLDTPETFLGRLTGLVKYALNSAGGRATLPALAAATAQRTTTVRRGLAWLQARAYLASVGEAGDELQLSATPPPVDSEAGQQASPVSTAAAATSAAQLEALLAETAAYRAFFRQAGKDTLMIP